MKVAISQPTYLSWIGYFGMIDLSDIFIFYNDVQFVKKQSWQRRNRIKTPQGWTWLTIPVKSRFKEKINEIQINNQIYWQEKHLKSIKSNDQNAPYFYEFQEILERIFNESCEYLADFTINIIREIAKFLNINTTFRLSSEFKSFGAKTDRLISILNQLNKGTQSDYLTGPSTKDYIEPSKFKDNDINLFRYYFSHPEYPQLFGTFIQYMSIIDLIFNVGSKKTLELIRKGNENALKKKPF